MKDGPPPGRTSAHPSASGGLAHVAGTLALIAETAAIYDLAPQDARRLRDALGRGGAPARHALARLGLEAPPAPPPAVATARPVTALALTVSQTCNLACGYCYASGGDFGGPATRMTWPVARQAVERLIGGAAPGSIVRIAFMGGEPMVARDLIRDTVDYANRRAAARAVRVGYSLTTNGTLVTPRDAEFFARHRFAVTVSLDGGRGTQDRMRPFLGGQGSFDRVARRVAELVARKDRLSLSARVTVTPDNLDLPRVIAEIAALGFDAVGVSPMISSPTGKGALHGGDFHRLLAAMTACGDAWMDATLARAAHPFANLATVLNELHHGVPRSHACGAARDYLAVGADGGYAACHRFVNDPMGSMGSLDAGIDDGARAAFLTDRAVESQAPCRTCWARRLCGGGCHHEVLHAGRPACDFVRGWLDYGLRCYARMIAERPDWFDAPA